MDHTIKLASIARVLGIALVAFAFAGAGRAQSQTCGSDLAAGTQVGWYGVVQDGYVRPGPEGRPEYLIVLGCRNAAGEAVPGRFALRLDDITALPPVPAGHGAYFRDELTLSLSGSIAGPDTVRSSAGQRLPFVSLRTARFVDPADSVAGYATRGQNLSRMITSDGTRPILVIDDVSFGQLDPNVEGGLSWLSIQEISVFRGAAALERYGQSALGGAIVVHTRPPRL